MPRQLFALLAVVQPLSFALAEPSSASLGTSKHLLIIGVDGCRPDALQAASTPSLDALIAAGVITYHAFAGGDAATGHPTHQATSSGPGWSSICTGVWVDKHGVSINGNFSSGNFAAYPHFFKHVRDQMPGSHLVSIAQWHPINQSLLEPFPGIADLILNVAGHGQAVEDAALVQLANPALDVLFAHFDDVDHAGHASGYSPSIPAYLQAIEETDAHIGNLMAAIQNRPNYANEDWLVVASTDHGGLGTGHGGHSSGERTIWILTSGGAAPAGVELSEGPGHTAVPPTALKHLGIAISPAWGFASSAFGLPDVASSVPAPADGAGLVSRATDLTWFPGAGASAHAIYLDTQPNLGPADFQVQQTATTYDPGSLASETTYYWRINTITPDGTIAGIEWSFKTVGDPLDDLVLALDFEGNASDHSGRHNHAIGFNGPNYVAGASG